MLNTAVLSVFLLASICCPAMAFVNFDPLITCFADPHIKGSKPVLNTKTNPRNFAQGKQVFKYAHNKIGVFKDIKGDAFEFIDLTDLKLSIDKTQIRANLSLAHLPNILIYNRPGTPTDALEYGWSISFDVDGDGTPDNDITIAISHYPDPRKNNQERFGGPLAFTQRDVWQSFKKGNDYGSKSLISDFKVARPTQSALLFTINKSAHPALQNITRETPVRFEASFNFNGNICIDVFPQHKHKR